MKKIILLFLFLFTNLLASDPFRCGPGHDSPPNYIRFDGKIWKFNHTGWRSDGDHAYCLNYFVNDPSRNRVSYGQNGSKWVMWDYVPYSGNDCPDNYDFNQTTGVCSAPPPICTANAVNPDPENFIDVTSQFSNSETCNKYLTSTMRQGAAVLDTNNSGDGCYDFKCFAEPTSICDKNTNPLSVKPSDDYIFSGIVTDPNICHSKVDGVNYIQDKVIQVNNLCPNNTHYYCYLLPLNPDSNVSDAPIPEPDLNNTIPNDNNTTPILSFNDDFNASNPQNLRNLNLSNTNTKLDTINSTFSEYKNQFGDWVTSKSLADTNLLNAQISTTSAITTGSSNIVDALNTSNQNLLNKIDTVTGNLFNPSVSLTGDGALSSDINSSIDTSFFDLFTNNLIDAWTNLTSDLNNTINSLHSLIDNLNDDKDNASLLNIEHSSVTTCPYNVSFDLSSVGGSVLPVSIDICKITAPLYPVTYPLFMIIFSSLIIAFAYKSLTRLSS